MTYLYSSEYDKLHRDEGLQAENAKVSCSLVLNQGSEVEDKG